MLFTSLYIIVFLLLINTYSKSYDYVPLPTVTVFGPTLPNVTQRDITVTDCYRPLPNFTVTCVTSVTDRNIVCFEQIFKVLFRKLM
jgi:hypothetical protein